MNTQEFKGNDKLLLGIVFGVLTFWLFAQSLINVVVAIRESVDIPMESLNMAISLTALFSGCFIVVAGGLADKFGRMRFTYIGFILSIIGSLCLIFATGTILFTLGRVIQGLSAACIMPATLALIKTYYDGAARQRALSFWSIGSWGGSGVCSLAGGAIATYLGWHWIFIISIIFAIAGMFLIRGTPESKVEENEKVGSFDYLGLFAFLITLLSLNVLITKGAKLGWTSNISVGLLGVVVVMGIVFIAIERRKKDRAFIDFALFEKASYSGATISNFLLNAVAGTLIVANTYIQMGRGFSSFQSGMMSIGYLIAVLLMIRVGEKILQKIQEVNLFESLEHIGNSRSVISMIGKIERELVETEEKNDDKFFLNQEVKRGYSDGVLSKNPLIIINGEVFKYDENLDTIKIPLKKSRIESVNLLNENGAKTIYGVEKRGAVIINAF